MKAMARRLSLGTVARAAIAVPVCAVLSWGIVSTALGTQAARVGNPQLMAVFADQPASGTQLAASLYAAKQYDAAAEIATQVARVAPLNASALASLGFSLRAQGQEAQANTVLRQAASLGWRNTGVLVWALQDAARNEDAKRVVDIADALARRQKVGSLTRAVFFGALQEPRMQRQFVARLAERPSWRPGFFADVRDHLALSQLDGMEAVLHALRRTNAPPTPVETFTYIDRLVELGAVGRARRYWAQAAHIPPAELVAQPFDGLFAHAASRAPDAPTSVFEWRLNPDLMDLVSFVSEGRGQALRVEADVENGAVVASQMLALPPGDHLLQTRLSGGSGATAPVGWTITCLHAAKPLLRTIPGDRNDELTRFVVTIPASQCPAQMLRLVGLNRFNAQPVAITDVSIR
jgi:hypothetical protein